MSKSFLRPIPIFDSIDDLNNNTLFNNLSKQYNHNDIKQALFFLKSYKGSQGTFNSYRREIEREGLRMPNKEWRPFVATTLKGEAVTSVHLRRF